MGCGGGQRDVAYLSKRGVAKLRKMWHSSVGFAVHILVVGAVCSVGCGIGQRGVAKLSGVWRC